jgi:hypothetical protein
MTRSAAMRAGRWPRVRSLGGRVSELRNIATLPERDAQCTEQVAALLLFVIAFIIAAACIALAGYFGLWLPERPSCRGRT